MIARSESGGAQPRAASPFVDCRRLPARRHTAAVMKYGWRSRAVINVAKSPPRRRNTHALTLDGDVDDVLSSYIGIILPSSATCNVSSC